MNLKKKIFFLIPALFLSDCPQSPKFLLQKFREISSLMAFRSCRSQKILTIGYLLQLRSSSSQFSWVTKTFTVKNLSTSTAATSDPYRNPQSAASPGFDSQRFQSQRNSPRNPNQWNPQHSISSIIMETQIKSLIRAMR